MVQWTAEKDAILLKGVFEMIDIKFTSEMTKGLAARIGEGCTPKAVTHRLGNFKKQGRPVANSRNAPVPAAVTTPKKTPTSTPRGRGRKAKPKSVDEDSEPKDDEETPESPTMNRKRSHMHTHDAEGNGKEEEVMRGSGKKIKKEIIVDEFLGILGYGGENEEDVV